MNYQTELRANLDKIIEAAKDVPKKAVIIEFPTTPGQKPILPDQINQGNIKDWQIQELKKKVKFYEDLIMGRRK